MIKILESVSSQELAPTRDYLRDVAKVMVSLQKLFLPKSPHDWQEGLEVVDGGLSTQSFELDGKATRLVMDLRRGVLGIGDQRWRLEQYSAQKLCNEIGIWLDQHGIYEQLRKPEFATNSPIIEAEASKQILESLVWTKQVLTRLATELQTGSTSPILLYPHHFDEALSWFPDDKLQYTAGFSFGDQTITDPYFYVTAYPEPTEFSKKELSSPGQRQTNDFSGAILKYNDLIGLDMPDEVVHSFLKSALA